MVLSLINNKENENLKSQCDNHSSPARLAKLLKFYNTKNWQGCGLAGTLPWSCWEHSGTPTLDSTLAASFVVNHTSAPMVQQSLLDIDPKKCIHR